MCFASSHSRFTDGGLRILLSCHRRVFTHGCLLLLHMLAVHVNRSHIFLSFHPRVFTHEYLRACENIPHVRLCMGKRFRVPQVLRQSHINAAGLGLKMLPMVMVRVVGHFSKSAYLGIQVSDSNDKHSTMGSSDRPCYIHLRPDCVIHSR